MTSSTRRTGWTRETALEDLEKTLNSQCVRLIVNAAGMHLVEEFLLVCSYPSTPIQARAIQTVLRPTFKCPSQGSPIYIHMAQTGLVN